MTKSLTYSAEMTAKLSIVYAVMVTTITLSVRVAVKLLR
jgi:hypothetical protein